MSPLVVILPFGLVLLNSLEVVVTTDDSALTMGTRVSLGSSPDLTQDAQLPLGLFSASQTCLRLACAFFLSS